MIRAAVAFVMLAGPAFAQAPPPVPVQAVPLPALPSPVPRVQPPPVQPAPSLPAISLPAPAQPPPAQPAPAVQAQPQAAPSQAGQPSPAPDAVQPAPAPPPDPWLLREQVDLAALDKVTARLTALSGKVGQPLHFGTLTIVARKCAVHRPDLPVDAAAFLDITDAVNPQAEFHGWVFVSAPSVSMFAHPLYDIRLTACR